MKIRNYEKQPQTMNEVFADLENFESCEIAIDSIIAAAAKEYTENSVNPEGDLSNLCTTVRRIFTFCAPNYFDIITIVNKLGTKANIDMYLDNGGILSRQGQRIKFGSVEEQEALAIVSALRECEPLTRLLLVWRGKTPNIIPPKGILLSLDTPEMPRFNPKATWQELRIAIQALGYTLSGNSIHSTLYSFKRGEYDG